jgi:pimeloyl-ACP methyl ester carboxylesterase
METIAVEREGSGPDVVLVHGGATPWGTWGALRGLRSRWTLVLPYRRGYPPSPPGDGDFEADADDLGPLLAGGAHLVAHSYGGLGALVAAGRAPETVLSLTIVETPLYRVADGDPEVAEMERLGDEFLTRGLDSDPARLRSFLRIAGVEEIPDGPLPATVQSWVKRAQGGRLPGEARPDLAALREAKVPALIASGGHLEAQERICDALAGELGGERLLVAGAGHFVQRRRAFVEGLERHLEAAERSR